MKNKEWIKWIVIGLLSGGGGSVTVPKIYELGMLHIWKPIIDEEQQTRFAIERGNYWLRVLAYQHDGETLDKAIELVNEEDAE